MAKPALALATLPTPMSLSTRAFFNVLDAAATALTASVTAGRGHLQLAQRLPERLQLARGGEGGLGRHPP